MGSLVGRGSVDLSAGRFSYLDAGEGPPLVFLHALGRSASDWLQVVDVLKRDWRCFAFDQRGHGDSVHTDRYRFELLENDFREFVDSLGLNQFTLIAHSMGGVVALLFAEKTPDRLSSLVLEDTTAPMDHHEYPTVPPEPPEPVDYDWEARRQLFEELSSPDPSWWTALPQVTTRTLLISSTQEARDVEETAERIPDLRIVEVEAGHWIHETERASFLAVVTDFLEHQWRQ